MHKYDDPRLNALTNWVVQGFFVVDELHQSGNHEQAKDLSDSLNLFDGLMREKHGYGYSVPFVRFIDAIMDPEHSIVPVHAWPEGPKGELS